MAKLTREQRNAKAARAYKAAQEKNQRLLKELAAEMAKHEAEATADGIHYGWVGDVSHVNEMLGQLLSHMRGEEE